MAWLGLAPQGLAQSEIAFTQMMAGRLRAALPGWNVRIAEPLYVIVTRDDGGQLSINLETLWSNCNRAPHVCAELVNRAVGGHVDMARSMNVPIQRSTLRLVLRPASYIAQVQAQAREVGQGLIVAKPFAADLWMVVVIDSAQSIRLLSERMLPLLGLTAEEAIAIARQNLAAALGPVTAVIPRISTRIGERAEDYEPSRVILHEQWAPLAAKAPGGLLVAVPGRNLLLYAGGQRPEMMRRGAREALADARAPMTDTVLRWTPQGWEPMK